MLASGFQCTFTCKSQPFLCRGYVDILWIYWAIRKEHDVTMLFVLKIQELRSKLVSWRCHTQADSSFALLAKSGDFGSIPQVHMAQLVSRDFVKKRAAAASGSVLNNSL